MAETGGKNNSFFSGMYALAAIGVVVFAAAGLDLLSTRTGIIFLALYTLMAVLFITGHIKILFLGFALISTALTFSFLWISADLNIIAGPPGLIFLVMWTVVMMLFLEYFFVSSDKRLEKMDFYKKYTFLNMLQVFIIMISMALVFFGPRITALEGNTQAIVLDLVTVLVILFTASAVLFGIFIYQNFSSARFMADFAQSLSGLSSGAESEKPPVEIEKTFRRMRLFSYVLLAASLISIYLIARYRIIDIYASVMSQRNSFMYALMNFRLPPAVLSLMKTGFFIFDIIILKEIIEMLTHKKIGDLINNLIDKTAPVKGGPFSAAETGEGRLIKGFISENCALKHGTKDGLCDVCAPVLEYAMAKLQVCPYMRGNIYEKPPCSACPKDCYSPDMRAFVKDIYKYW